MTKFLLLGLAAAIAAPAVSASPQEIEFTRNGEHYVARIHDASDGRHIDGRNMTTGADFSLVVADGQVSGSYRGTGVDFATPSTETASR